MKEKQVLKRYYKEFFVAMVTYVIAVITSVTLLTRFEFPQAIRIFISITPVIPTIFVLVAIMRSLRDSDELQQKVQLNAVIFSCVATGLVTFSYGFLEGIGIPKFPTILVLPMMFAFWGIGAGYFAKRYQ